MVLDEQLYSQLAPRSDYIAPIRKLLNPNVKFIAVAEDVLDEIDNELFLCRICLGRVQAPIVTECLHRFCKDCMARHFRHYETKVTSHRCPLCNSEIRSVRSMKADKKIQELLGVLFPEDDNDASTVAAREEAIMRSEIRKAQIQHLSNVTDMKKRSRELEPQARQARMQYHQDQHQQYQQQRQQQQQQYVERAALSERRGKVKPERRSKATPRPNNVASTKPRATNAINAASSSTVVRHEPPFVVDNVGAKARSPPKPRDNGEIMAHLLEVEVKEDCFTALVAAMEKLQIPRTHLDTSSYFNVEEPRRTDHVLSIGYISIKMSRNPQEKQLAKLKQPVLRVAPDTTVAQLKYFVDDQCNPNPTSIQMHASNALMKVEDISSISLQVCIPVPIPSRISDEETPNSSKHRLYTISDNSMNLLQVYNWYISISKIQSEQCLGLDSSNSTNDYQMMRILYRTE